MIRLVLALALALPAAVHAGFSGRVVEVHADNLSFLGAMPAGADVLPISAGTPLAALTPIQLQEQYRKDVPPGLAAAPQLAAAPELPASVLPSAAPAPAQPQDVQARESGEEQWRAQSAKYDGASPRGPPATVAVSHVPQPSVEKVDAWFKNDVDPRLAAEVPDERKRFELEGAAYERFKDLPSLVTTWRERGADPALMRAVLDDSFKGHDGIRVVLTARLWNKLDAKQRELMASSLHAGPIRQGARLLLNVKPSDDLAAIASKYAAGRDPRPIERLLRRAVSKGYAYVPLESLLPKRVRKRFGTFADCSGPNCVNAVLDDQDFYDDGTTMIARLNATHRRLASGEPILPGDKLVYTDMNKNFVHIAESIGDGWVYTKNGLGRHYPYIFQPQTTMEAVHFHSGEFRLIVFRPK